MHNTKVPLYLNNKTDECWVGYEQPLIANQQIVLFFKCLTELSKYCKNISLIKDEDGETPEDVIFKKLDQLDNKLKKIDPFVWNNRNSFWPDLTNQLRMT